MTGGEETCENKEPGIPKRETVRECVNRSTTDAVLAVVCHAASMYRLLRTDLLCADGWFRSGI